MSTVAITYGRFNPPHKGHQLIFQKLSELVKSNKADQAIVFCSTSHDHKKNPLTIDQKIDFLKKITNHFGNIPVVQGKNTIDVLKSVSEKYDSLIVLVGEDRQKEFKTLFDKYNHKEYDFDSIEVQSVGDRSSSDQNNIASYSASRIRQHITDFKKETSEFLDDDEKAKLASILIKQLS